MPQIGRSGTARSAGSLGRNFEILIVPYEVRMNVTAEGAGDGTPNRNRVVHSMERPPGRETWKGTLCFRLGFQLSIMFLDERPDVV